LWSAGRYEAVGDRIAVIAADVVETADRRAPMRGAAVVDLACGTGAAAISAAAKGAEVTAVDITAVLIEQGRNRAGAAGVPIDWVIADAADTGLPSAAFDSAVSNMGIVFVDPARQVGELARLLRPTGTLVFSSWVRSRANPLFDPIVATLGPPPATRFRPDEWGEPDLVAERLGPDFTDIEIHHGEFAWEFSSLAAVLRFLTDESPMHVDIFARAEAHRHRLAAAFEDALAPHVGGDGAVRFFSPYAVIAATRR